MGSDIKSTQNVKMDDTKDKVVVLLGKTGEGKSSFINSITGTTQCKVVDGSKAGTTDLKRISFNSNGINYYFIDTPGLDDGKGDAKNISVLGDIRKYQKINVFLICIKFGEVRFTESLRKTLIQFMILFPCSSFWSHVLIIRTIIGTLHMDTGSQQYLA